MMLSPDPTVRFMFGSAWVGNYDQFIRASGQDQLIYRADGKIYKFVYNSIASTWLSDADVKSNLEPLTTGWRYKDSVTENVELYDAEGKLQSITSRSGYHRQLIYSNGTTAPGGGYVLDASGVATTSALPAGLLIQITDSNGRALTFGYDSSSRVVKITDPAGGIYSYTYNNYGNLTSVRYPDNKVRSYLYDETANMAGASFPHSLTGIVDENNQRFATYKYDARGRAVSTEHGVGANKISIAYTSDTGGNVTSSAVTDALNTTRTYTFTNVLGVVKSASSSQPCTSGCGAASATTYDANGNIATKTDFNGNVTTYSYDLSRNLETSRTEAHGTPLARTITTAWHATYRLPTQIDEPGRRTTFNHDANGNVLSKTITDTALNKSRTWTYTYNSLGQVLTEDGPRTDVSDITTYTYYATTSAGQYTLGDLATITNALGQITTFSQYDANGRPLSITDANGFVTTLTYSPRGWLTSRSVGSAITTYEYDNVGQLTKVTQPDGSFLAYTYDTAHRLTDITDNAGNKIHYTLDAMGNRIEEEVFDPANTLTQTRTRVYDALNRLQQEIGGTTPGSQITAYGYDNNGNLTSTTDPLNRVTAQSYDALDRLVQITDPANGTTQQSFNARDQLASVTDPRSVLTQYTRNALGDLQQQQSPDSGSTAHVYDAAGNITQTTDARGVVANYSYDALNRVTAIGYPGNSAENVTFSYDSTTNGNKGIGRLTGYSNDGGSTVLVYDARGNLIQQTAQVGSEIDVTTYQYDNADRITQITYPSGRVVDYQRDALGRITQVQTRDDANASHVTLVGNVSYEPFGPPKGLAFGNGVTTTIQHDLDYRVSRITTSASAVWDFVYGYDAADNITSLTDQAGSASKTYVYDALDRLTSDTNPTGLWSLSYDANGNRLNMDWEFAPGSIWPFTYQYATNSNRLTQLNGLTQTHDAAGNRTADGVIGYNYNHANRLGGRSYNGNPSTTYHYNALGQRVVTQDLLNSQATHIHYDSAGKYLGTLQLNNSGSWLKRYEYIWLDDQPIAQIVTSYGANNAVTDRRQTYIHADHLNTPRLMTDAGPTIVWRWDRDAFGLASPDEDPDGTAPADRLDLRFPGQILDEMSGMYYNYYRDYDPVSGRYLQSDPIGLVGGLNTYAYVNGKPLKYSDPKGLYANIAIQLGIRAIGGRAAGAAVAAALRQAAGPVGGTVLACILTGYCQASEPANEDGQCPPSDENPRGNPYDGEPGEWVEHPHGKQDRKYGADGTPAVDIDYGHDHGQGSPHAHNWENGIRGPGVPVSLIK